MCSCKNKGVLLPAPVLIIVTRYVCVQHVCIGSQSQVDHGWQCVLVWQVSYIWGAADRDNEAWVTGRSQGFYCKLRHTEGEGKLKNTSFVNNNKRASPKETKDLESLC